MQELVASSSDLKGAAKARKRQYDELGQRLRRAKSIDKLVEKISTKRTIMMAKEGTVKKMKIENANGSVRSVYKWKKMRKR